MTKRVIQTDLFAAFKVSQQQAEDQYGQKKKIHVEGSSLRQVAEISSSVADSGYEVIVSKKPAPPSPMPAVAETVTKIKALDDTVTEIATQLSIVKEESPVVETPVVEAPVAEEVETVEPEQVVEEEKPVAKTAETSPRRNVVTRKTVRTEEVTSRLAKVKTANDAERITVSSVVRPAIKKKPVQIEEVPEEVKKPRKQAVAKPAESKSYGGLLMKVAAVITALAAAYVFSNNSVEEPNKPIQPQPQVQVGKIIPTPKHESDSKREITETRPPIFTEEILPIATGDFTIMLCSGISRRSARKLANYVRSQQEVRANNWDVYEHNTAVYVGRFEDKHDPKVKVCEEYCRNLLYDGSKQFKSALFFPLPEPIRKGSN